MKATQSGFTLIELIVVIIILGILAATALPRYAALQTQARIAKLSGALGAVKGAAALVHGACLATQTPVACDSNSTSLSMEGNPVSILNQYPTANQAGIIFAAGMTISQSEGFNLNPAGSAAAGDTVTVQVLGGDNPANCSFSYTAPTGPNLAPVITAPVTTGC